MCGADPSEALADSKEAGVDSARSDQTEPYSGIIDPTMEPTASSQGAQQQTLDHKEGPAGSSSRSSATHATSVQIVRGPAELEEGSSNGTSYVGGEEGKVLEKFKEPPDHGNKALGDPQQQLQGYQHKQELSQWQEHQQKHQHGKKEANQGSKRVEGALKSHLPPKVGTSGDNNSERDQAFQSKQTGEQSPSSLTTQIEDSTKYARVRQFTLFHSYK